MAPVNLVVLFGERWRQRQFWRQELGAHAWRQWLTNLGGGSVNEPIPCVLPSRLCVGHIHRQQQWKDNLRIVIWENLYNIPTSSALLEAVNFVTFPHICPKRSRKWRPRQQRSRRSTFVFKSQVGYFNRLDVMEQKKQYSFYIPLQ